MKALAILQARFSSSRLPGKVLFPILGVPMLFRQIERLKRSAGFAKLIVATSVDSSDDIIANECIDRGVEYFRGSLDDVLDRLVQSARPYDPETVVRLTGDCPLADPSLIDKVIHYFYEGKFDYVSNCNPPTFPDGLDVEVVRFSCFEQAHREAILPSHRESAPAYIREHPEKFRIGNVTSDVDLSHLRWTVDEPEDFEFVRCVYEELYPVMPDFATEDILELLKKNPRLGSINSSFARNEGLKKLLAADADFLRRNI